MIAYFSNITYAIGGLVVFLFFLTMIALAAHGSKHNKKTGKDDRDDITCAGFSDMISDNH